MAYVANQEDENEKQAAQGASGGPVLSNASASINPAVSGGTTPGAGTPGGAAKPAGSGFVNLNKYIGANAGNDAAMGEAVDKTVGKVAEIADTAATGFKTKADTAIQSNTITDTDNTTGAVTGLAGGNTWNGNDSKFSTLWNATWKGPKTARDAATPEYDAARAAAQTTATTAGLAGNNSGRKTLLSDTYKSPKAYTGGEKSLDSFILGGGKQGAAAMQGIQDKWGKQDEKFAGIAGLVDQGITTGTQTTDDTRTKFRKAVGDTQTSLETDVDAAVTQATTANTDAANVNAGFTPEEIAIANSHGLDPTSFVARGGNFGAKDFLKSKADSYEKLKALLKGVDPAATFKFGTDVVTKGGGKASTVDTNRVAGVKGLTGISNTLNNRLTTKQGENVAALTKATGQIKDLNYLKSLGFSDEELRMVGSEIQGLDANKFINPAAALDLESVATQDEIDEYNKNLLQASGLAPGGLPGIADGMPGVKTPKTLGKAKSTPQVNIDTAGLSELLRKLVMGKKVEKADGERVAAAIKNQPGWAPIGIADQTPMNLPPVVAPVQQAQVGNVAINTGDMQPSDIHTGASNDPTLVRPVDENLPPAFPGVSSILL